MLQKVGDSQPLFETAVYESYSKFCSPASPKSCMSTLGTTFLMQVPPGAPKRITNCVTMRLPRNPTKVRFSHWSHKIRKIEHQHQQTTTLVWMLASHTQMINVNCCGSNMCATKTIFDRFCSDKATECPFNNIRIARNAFHCKWLVSKGCGATSVFRRGHCHLIPTSALSLATVNTTIANGNAFPVPTNLNDVVDTVEWWGRRVSSAWEQTLLHLLMNDCFKDKNTPIISHQHFAFVAILLQERIREHVAHGSDDFENTMSAHVEWFDNNWQPTLPFFDFVIQSLRWLHADSPISNHFNVTPQQVTLPVVTPTRVPSCVSSAEDQTVVNCTNCCCCSHGGGHCFFRFVPVAAQSICNRGVVATRTNISAVAVQAKSLTTTGTLFPSSVAVTFDPKARSHGVVLLSCMSTFAAMFISVEAIGSGSHVTLALGNCV